jgi:hypothetical protein
MTQPIYIVLVSTDYLESRPVDRVFTNEAAALAVAEKQGGVAFRITGMERVGDQHVTRTEPRPLLIASVETRKRGRDD